MLKTKFLILFLFITLGKVLIAQNSICIRTSAGAAGFGNPLDGYYFSFDIGIPIIKGLELAPTFTNCSNISHRDVSYYWTYNEGVETTIKPDDYLSGNILSTYELYLIANPFKWIRNPKLNKVDIGLGIGYGLKAYKHYVYSFIGKDISGIQENFGTRQNFSAKFFYNHHYKKFFLGFIVGIVDLSQDANSIIGLQFGVKI